MTSWIPQNQDKGTSQTDKKTIRIHDDLSRNIRGMYRILDLINEQGSGGLVDKIIIAQESLERFINDVVPGAYTSLTKVDFKALDSAGVKPFGVYGSKTQIVEFLFSAGSINTEIRVSARLLTSATDDSTGPRLRSGLYFVRISPAPDEAERVIVLYWPEDTTWDDDAISSVRRNRVTFMRYLSKIADQTMCLVSREHSKAIVWNESSSESCEADVEMEDESDRLFTFEVTKSNEEEESASTRAGIKLPNLKNNRVPPPEHSVDLAMMMPKIIAGETQQGLLTTRFIEPSTHTEHIQNEKYNSARLKSLFSETASFTVTDNITEASVDILAQHGMQKLFPVELQEWQDRRTDIRKEINIQKTAQLAELDSKLEDMKKDVRISIREALLDEVINQYPTLELELSTMLNEYTVSGKESTQDGSRFSKLTSLYPSIGSRFTEHLSKEGLNKIVTPVFRSFKLRLVMVEAFLDIINDGLSSELRKKCIDSIVAEGDLKKLQSYLKEPSKQKWWKNLGLPLVDLFISTDESVEERIAKAVNQKLKTIDDPSFLSSLDDLLEREPTLATTISSTVNSAKAHFMHCIPKIFETLVKTADAIQRRTLVDKIEQQCVAEEISLCKESTRALVQLIQSKADPNAGYFQLLATNSSPYSPFQLDAHRHRRSDPLLEYKIQPFTLIAHDLQDLRLNKCFVPSPKVEHRAANTFQLPLRYIVRHIQMLANGKCLLVIDTGREFRILCETLASLEHAISREECGKSLHQSKLGKDVLIAFDEMTRSLAILQIHLYLYDEAFNSLRASDTINLSQWYTIGATIRLACFISGCEELLLVDSGCQARIFSVVAQQFRPAAVELKHVPMKAMSSPDGSCLFLAFSVDSGIAVHAYHWSTFGSNEGIPLDIVDLCAIPVASSFENRSAPHLLWLNPITHVCQSVALDITKRVTEFSFQEKGSRHSGSSNQQRTIHNSLIDCHADVWTRFPVVPAISRQTLVTNECRLPRRLIFVTDLNQQKFEPYFSKMIHYFKQQTRKPTGDVLKKLQIESASFEDVLGELVEEHDWDISELRVGEWLVDVLCLIPIHLAVTRDNRFMPLKDGVSSSSLEKSLLGASVSQIVDMLSFGWYESIFQSYRATKLVRVVSSMGEQSVGKSFALNHLADTSFAGSAMRTTEGVWMSVTPTDSALIVALDFEGVHSIERSAQEDALLVLFNTAISNLILFRNNFALSRDIAGMFQSFQSSSAVLDPKANPTLFQSTLVIIIKDVVESDKKEIVKEFSLKFQKIVQDEQDANFISKLHAGRLSIIPWPVIESKQFYTLYPVLKATLDKQQVTHPTAGEFLQTLKTMMAKLKANDWGALSQTLAAHRASQIMQVLPNALMYGYADADREPLKNLDTNMVIDSEDEDSSAIFYLPGSSSITSEFALTELMRPWTDINKRDCAESDRTWIEDLSRYLLGLADRRIEHIRQWVDSNLSRFKVDNASIDALHRLLDSMAIDLKSQVELCKMKCESCNLLCIRSRRHDLKEAHHCDTDHKCTRSCEFDDGHDEEDTVVPCGFAAGHTGKHICMVDTHLCGEKCDLHDRKGCLGECIKVVGHPDESHLCASRTHSCSKPCDLARITLADGTEYSCSDTCSHPSDVEHSEHSCDNRLCPLQCQLCVRLCCGDHLHGMDKDAVHLCGEQHACRSFCAAPGICDIETQPQSVEATFTGRHETFQYTKVCPMLPMRLQCVLPVPAGRLEHPGIHSHSGRNAFHYCEARCADCGYYCSKYTTSLSHSQQLHETRHGSMSKTTWSLENPDEAIELGGRKFGTGDDGAPMLCNIVCTDRGRHPHADYCRAPTGQPCRPVEGVQHIAHQIRPHPNRPKDWITHSLHWRRMGKLYVVEYPYPREHQINFAKCDSMCPGPEHAATANSAAQPSYCILPIFHPPAAFNDAGMGYISNDGHHFSCKNPTVMQQAFHVIFVIDRSGSMGNTDRQPLANTPTTPLIGQYCNNRLGAVYSALHAFWTSRNAALSASGPQASRKDSYSVILFDHNVNTAIADDFRSTPDQLLNVVLRYGVGGGTDYTSALDSARTVMTTHWSTERSPVIIFLSDGECSVADPTMQSLCREAVNRGKPLSFHAVAFGPRNGALRRMAQIALEAQNRAPRDPLLPPAAYVESSYAEALDSVRLAETFLGLADSLKKTRGALLR
ncbi:hypothetical protein BDP27DRAFT_1467712 [Rhodocollybia butyracea]|uniref:VWFA domain-containing protein n=1 Tax=Rhodocollybia butyracea TaxID=206335 RepID=A0A9P5U3G0_9AGAR|nr:hypothetical protein BDP27DRAFT_1467712 [Rhodocollybia butyracea]